MWNEKKKLSVSVTFFKIKKWNKFNSYNTDML